MFMDITFNSYYQHSIFFFGPTQGPLEVTQPNIPRPPDKLSAPLHTSSSLANKSGDGDMERDEFLDANDVGVQLSEDSDMEEVAETPGLSQ